MNNTYCITSENFNNINKLILDCSMMGGGKIIITKGEYTCTFTIELMDNVELYFEPRVKLLLDNRMSQKFSALIHARKRKNISITGAGFIDGNGKSFIIEDLKYIYKVASQRPYIIFLEDCKNVLLQNFTIVDAPAWSIRLCGCDNVNIYDITIKNDLKIPNNDGIDPDHCKNVIISHSHISCGDDCIVIKTTKEYSEYGASENIVVRDCILTSTSCALKIGTETVCDIKNVIFDSCVINSTNRAMGIMLRDNGNINNIIFSNITVDTRLFYDSWWGKAEPIHISVYRRHREIPTGCVKDVVFKNIRGNAEAGIFITSEESDKIENVFLDEINISLHKKSRWNAGIYDIRPWYENGLIRRKTSGLFAERVKNFIICNSKIRLINLPENYYDKEIKFIDCYGWKCLDFEIEG